MRKFITRALFLSLAFFCSFCGEIQHPGQCTYLGIKEAQASQLAPAIRDRSVSVSTSSVAILPADNGSRRYLLIENVCSGQNIGISIGTAAIGTAGTVTLTPGGSLEFKAPDVPQDAFNAISASGTCGITIWEVR